ncbi:13417_t:CDS:1, partial [Racocetra fulgida]
MSLKFYIVFAFIVLMALSTWSAPVAEESGGNFVDMKAPHKRDAKGEFVDMKTPHKRDASPELSSAFHLMADLKEKREVNDEPSKREAEEPHLSKRALFYR